MNTTRFAPTFSRTPYLLGLLCLALITLTSCTTSTDAHAEGEAYIRANIAELSPRSAVLGGSFYVTEIMWEDEDTALVTYEDGHIQLRGRTDVSLNNGVVTATRIRIDTTLQ